MKTAAARIILRPMTLGDIPEVMEIEQEAFPTMWPRTAFQREIEQNRLARYLVAWQLPEEEEDAEGSGPFGERLPPEFAALEPKSQGLGRFLDGLRQMASGEDEQGDQATSGESASGGQIVAGFLGTWVMSDEVHIVSIAVREEQRGQGVGEMMLIGAILMALEKRLDKISLECRISNSVALRLYEKYSFQRAGIRPRYYSDNHEDAYIMILEGVKEASFQERFQALREAHLAANAGYEMQL